MVVFPSFLNNHVSFFFFVWRVVLWVWVFSLQEAGAHPITGIIVLVLAVIQPIMALFRPHPGEDKYVKPKIIECRPSFP